MKPPRGFLLINGVRMPTPDSFDFTEFDLDSASTGRSESGFLNRERVRAAVASYDVGYVSMKSSDAAAVRDAIDPAELTVEVWFLGDYVTRTMYAGDRKFQTHIDANGNEIVSMNFTLTEY